jgi:hypothetical protein
MNKKENFKFLFLDESEILKAKNGWNYFMICGLIVDSAELINLEKFLINICEETKINRLKDLRKSNKFQKKEKLSITEKIANFLEEISSKILVAILGNYSLKKLEIIRENLNKNGKNGNNTGKYIECLQFIIERFFLELKNSNSNGFIFFESFSKEKEHILQEKLYNFIMNEELRWIYSGKSEGKFIEYIYPTVVFLPGKSCKILEIPDLIAGAVNEAMKNRNMENFNFKKDIEMFIERLPENSSYLKYYWKLFCKNSSGKTAGWGLKIWV